MLVECGFVRAVAEDGSEFTFTPSFGRIAALGSPLEIVALYAALYGPRATQEAAHVLAGLCDQEDPTPLIGGQRVDLSDPEHPRWTAIEPAMAPAEMVIIARHLMHHGIVGKSAPEQQDAGGRYCERFDAAEYIASARVHLKLSGADAEALSMTEFHGLMAMKYPQAAGPAIPTQKEYDAAMAAADAFIAKLKERRGG